MLYDGHTIDLLWFPCILVVSSIIVISLRAECIFLGRGESICFMGKYMESTGLLCAFTNGDIIKEYGREGQLASEARV